MNTQAIQKKLDDYMKTATPEQVVKEFEDLGVEFECATMPDCWCYRKLKKCKGYMDCLQMNTKTFNNELNTTITSIS